MFSYILSPYHTLGIHTHFYVVITREKTWAQKQMSEGRLLTVCQDLKPSAVLPKKRMKEKVKISKREIYGKREIINNYRG